VKLTYEDLIKAHGEPIRSQSRLAKRRGASGSMGQHAPGVLPKAQLWFRCGLTAELTGGLYNPAGKCNGNHRVNPEIEPVAEE
jgi:hypothetical protein